MKLRKPGVFTAATLALMVLADKRYHPVGVHAPLFSFTIALLISTWSILSIGFLIASIVPPACFAQLIGGFIMYPMGWFLGTLRARRSAAASAPHSGPSAAANLCRGGSPGNLDRRHVVGAYVPNHETFFGSAALLRHSPKQGPEQ